MILNSPTISGSLTVTGNILTSGSITLSGSVASASYAATASFWSGSIVNAATASFVALAQSASNAVSAQTASFANAFTVAGNLTAQTLVVQTVTSSIIYSSGSNIFGNNIANTQVMTGSVTVTGSLAVVTNGTEFQVTSTGVRIGNIIGDTHNITGSVGISGSVTNSGLIFNTNDAVFSTAGSITKHATVGLVLRGVTASVFDFAIYSANGTALMTNSTGTNNINFNSGQVWFNGGNVGIGTTSPATFLHVNGATAALPSGSGTTQSVGNRIRLSTAAGTGVLDIGCAGGIGMWLQSTDLTDLNLKYPILLNPNGGNVGIGTSAPSQKLTIDASNGFPFIDFKVSGTGYGDIGYNTSAAAFTIGAYSTTPMAFYTNSAERMRITSGGSVLIGSTTDNAYALQVNGGGSSPLYLRHTSAASGRFWKVGPDASSNFIVYNESNTGCFISWTGTSWTGNSDIRLKNIIKKIDNATESLLTLNPVFFSWKNDETNKENIGLIAQDVEKVFPQLIDLNSDGMLGVRYTELIPVLVKAIQELKAQNDDLQSQINELKAQ